MNEQQDANSHDVDGWPVPSRKVLRELDPPAVVWSEPESPATPQTGRSARG